MSIAITCCTATFAQLGCPHYQDLSAEIKDALLAVPAWYNYHVMLRKVQCFLLQHAATSAAAAYAWY